MPLILPQYVKMRNARLQICSTCMNIMVTGLVIAQFTYFGQYGRLLNIEGAATVWTAGEQNTSDLQMIGISANSEPICKASRTFDYWRDASGSARYTNHSCWPVCRNSSSKDCVPIDDHVVRESHNSVIMVSQFQDRAGLYNFFASSVEGIQVNFAYAFRIPKVPWYYIPQNPKQWALHSSQAITTLL